MAKNTKSDRRALQAAEEALHEVAGVAKTARKAAKDLPKKTAKQLEGLAFEARELADASKKTIRKNPQKLVKRAAAMSAKVRKATVTAIAKAEKKARLRVEAERAAIEAKRAAAEADARQAEATARKAEAKKLAKAAAKAEKAAARAADEAATAAVDLAHSVDEAEAASVQEPTVEEPTSEAPGSNAPASDVPEVTSGLAARTVAQLRAQARDEGRVGYSRMTKAQLVALLSA